MTRLRSLLLAVGLLTLQSVQSATYLATEDFVQQNFQMQPQLQTLWIDTDIQRVATEILGHRYRGLRLRYWLSNRRTLWVLDEIGKEEPITIGVVIDDGRVDNVAILAFRESRGWEVRHPFFTRQFEDLSLNADQHLSGHIDGISGATLSVKAVTNVTRLALYLHQTVMVDPVSAGHAVADQ